MNQNQEEINFGAGAELTQEEQQKFVRKGKRRNGFFIPGSSNPMVAKMFCDAVQKECFGVKVEEEHQAEPIEVENPEDQM
jgi:hypothetical protein